MENKKVKVSIVIAAYNEEESIKMCYEQVNEQCLKLNKDYEIIFVNDGSKDNTLNILADIAQQNKKVKVINFSRNFGQRPALLAGFEKSTGDVVINLDADLQDPVFLIDEFVKKWEEGFDVVLAKRKKRKGESWFKKLTSKLYYKLYKKITNSNTPLDCGISRLLSRKVVNHIVSMPEHNIYLAGLTEFVGFKQTVVEYDRDERKFGKTKYGLKSLMNLAVNNIMPYTSAPVNFVLGLGAFLSFAGIAMAVTFTILLLCGVGFSNLWWLGTALTALSGVITFSVGIVGMYVVRVYVESLNRPKYIVAQTYNLGDCDEQN